MSATLLKARSKDIIKRVLEDKNSQIKIKGISINKLGFADDRVIMAESIKDLQRLMDIVLVCSEGYGLTLNVHKTRLMKITKCSKGKKY